MTKEAHGWGNRDRDDEKWPWIDKERSKGREIVKKKSRETRVEMTKEAQGWRNMDNTFIPIDRCSSGTCMTGIWWLPLESTVRVEVSL